MISRSKLVRRIRSASIFCGASKLIVQYSWILRRFPQIPLPFRGLICSVALKALAQKVAIRLGTSDADVLIEIFGDGEYQDVIDRMSNAPRNIIDFGSNIGASILFWHHYFPNARLVAVEPDPGNMSLCRLNVDRAGFSENVIFIEACVAGQTRHVSLDSTKGAWGIAMRESDGVSKENVVPALSVLELLKDADLEGKIDLLKCDVEGAEREIYYDCRDWLKSVRNLVIEIHKPYDRESFIQDIERGGGGFKVTVLHGNGFPEVLFLQEAQ